MPAPMVESKRSTNPFCPAIFNFCKFSIHACLKSVSITVSETDIFLKNPSFAGIFTKTFVVCVAPFVSKKSREMLTISFPLQFIIKRLLSVTTATSVASKFSSKAYSINFCTFCLETTTAILSCDSDIASSVPSKPSYFLGTASKLIVKPSASSPMATETPPAPKSLHLLIILLTSVLRNNLCNFLSVGGLPFCTSAPQFSIDETVCCLEEPVAPPQPSRPVLPPTNIMISPDSGICLMTFSFFAAPITAPISILFATKPGSYTSTTCPVANPI